MSTSPSPRPSGRSEPSLSGDDPDVTAREARLAAVVEAFLRSVRSGGSLDPEPYVRACEDLREDLVPLLHSILRLESLAGAIERRDRGRRAADGESPPDGDEPA